MGERNLPLLLAVTREVDRLNESNPRLQVNGGNIVRWPTVTAVMDFLQPGCGWTKDTTAKAHRNAKNTMSPEAIEALIAGVDRVIYAEAVAQVHERGMRPTGRPPAVPGVNQDKPAAKAKPTAQERLAGIKRAEEDIMDRVEELAAVEVEIEQERSKRRIAERMADQYKKRAAFVASAMAMLKDIVVPMEPAGWNPVEVPAVHIKREQEAVLILSDIHIGDRIDADTMGALNVYNFDVFREKLRRLYAGVRDSLEVLREYGPVRKLRIFGLGDWATGVNIFPGQAHHIEFGAMEQCMRGANELATFHHELLELPGIELVEEEDVPGNHGRPGRKGNDPFEDNWDLVMYEFLRLRLINEPRISVKWHKSWWMLNNVLGWQFLCAHGDEVKGNLGIPNYGFRRWGSRWRELLDSVGKRYDYGVIGHHHVEVEEKNLIISGAWPGASFFSAKELQSGGEATQMLYSVSEDYGITWRRRLPLDPPKRPVASESA